MNREDAKDLTLSVMIIVNIVLVAATVWLYCKTCSLENSIREISDRMEKHINPPPQPEKQSLANKAKATFEKVKSAAQKGYEAARDEYKKNDDK
jgi:hypothetical protein